MASLAKLDANLLLVLKVLLEECHVTRASELLHLSQPATSAALRRLRRHFDDPLLIRAGNGMERSALGEVLLPLAIDAVEGFQRVIRAGERFVPADTERKFRIRASQYTRAVLGERLAKVAASAPRAGFHVAQFEGTDAWASLRETDVVVMPTGFGTSGTSRPLFRDVLVCYVDPAHPLVRAGADVVELLARAPHLAVRFGPGFLNGRVTQPYRLIKSLELSPRAAVTVTDFGGLNTLLLGSGLVLVGPARAQEVGLLDRALLALPIPGAAEHPLVECAFWHPSRDADAAIQWLVAELAQGSDFE